MAEYNKPKLTPVFDNLETAIRIWWKNLKAIVLVYLWGALFVAIAFTAAGIISGLGLWMTQLGLGMLGWVLYCLAAIAVLIAIYFSIRAYIGIFLLLKKDFAGQPREIFKESKDYFGSYLVVAILTAVIVFLLCLLLIIPGLIYGVLYCLSVYVFFFEGQRGMAALRRSRELVRGYWWAVFGRLVLIGLLSWLFISILSVPLSGDERNLFYFIWSSIVQIVSYLIGPIVMLYTYSIYKDLVRIKK